MSSWHDRVPSFQDHPGVWSISAICHIQTNGRNHHIHPNQDANAQSNHLIEWRLTNLMVPHVRHVAVMVNKWSTCRMKPLTDTYGSNAWNIKDIYIYITVLDQTFYAHDFWPCKSPWFSDTAPSTGSKFLGDPPGKSARGWFSGSNETPWCSWVKNYCSVFWKPL